MASLDTALTELQARRARALEMGGVERIERQHLRGKKTVRERISILLDADTFREYGQLASHIHALGVSQRVDEVTPADGVVFGFGKIAGRMVCVIAEDFTVKGGTFGIIHGRKKLRAIDIAHRERVPVIWIQDGAGARAQEMIGEGLPAGPHYLVMARHSGTAPQVSIVMGPSAGDSSLIASLCEFIIMVEGTSMLAAGGPPIVKAAMGKDVFKEELGGSDVHCRISGCADNVARTEEEAITMARRFLSYLPGNAWEYPPHQPSDDPIERADEDLISILPDNPRTPYDMKRVISAVVDRESFFEIKPLFAPMVITGFARMDGHPVGIVANQPKVMAGTITEKAARKIRHFIDLCTAYHLPLVFLQDVPGVLPGPDSEREGTLRSGLAITYALAWSDVPKITVVIRKAFGYGACAMCGGGSGQTVTLAWPCADFGSLPPESAVLAAHTREIEAATNPEQLKRELMENYERSSGAFHAAGIFTLDDVIDPRETRLRVIQALELARQRRTMPAQPAARCGVMP